VHAEFWHGNLRRPFGRARSRWEDTINITLKKWEEEEEGAWTGFMRLRTGTSDGLL
jgi:hypothetical protein